MQELLLLQEPGATAWWAGTELGLLNPSLAAAPEQVTHAYTFAHTHTHTRTHTHTHIHTQA